MLKVLLPVTAFAILCTACPPAAQTQNVKRTPVETAPIAKVEPKPSEGGSVAIKQDDAKGPEAPSSPIYFEFDSDELTPSSQDTLKQMAAFLGSRGDASLTIEGHCDETGSTEYNLALGERRARVAREYLVKLGVDMKRVKTISYGEERPAVEGADEIAHSKNRRGQFDLAM